MVILNDGYCIFLVVCFLFIVFGLFLVVGIIKFNLVNEVLIKVILIMFEVEYFVGFVIYLNVICFFL